jgi:hypothetical protein
MSRHSDARQIKAWIKNHNEGALRLFQALVGDRVPGGMALLNKQPAASSILTISAPILLLSAALHSFLAGFDFYPGHMCTKNPDKDAADQGDSHRVFLVSARGLGVCYGVLAFLAFFSRGKSTSVYEVNHLLRQATSHGNKGLASPQQHPHSASDRSGTGTFSKNESSLAQALYYEATLRERSAEADRRVAKIYQELGRREQPASSSCDGQRGKKDIQ